MLESLANWLPHFVPSSAALIVQVDELDRPAADAAELLVGELDGGVDADRRLREERLLVDVADLDRLTARRAGLAAGVVERPLRRLDGGVRLRSPAWSRPGSPSAGCRRCAAGGGARCRSGRRRPAGGGGGRCRRRGASGSRGGCGGGGGRGLLVARTSHADQAGHEHTARDHQTRSPHELPPLCCTPSLEALLLTQLRWVAKLTTQLVTGKALPQGLRPVNPRFLPCRGGSDRTTRRNSSPDASSVVCDR